MLDAGADADSRRKWNMQENEAIMAVGNAHEPIMPPQIAADAIAPLLKRVKLLAEEVGGVERLREILDVFT